MFDIVNETIINSATYRQQNPKTGVVKNVASFKVIPGTSETTAQYPELTGPLGLFIAKRGIFQASDVHGADKDHKIVTRTVGWNDVPDTAVFSDTDLSALYTKYGATPGNYRMVIYAELSSGSNDGAFAKMNPVKGRPEIYEFSINATGTIGDQISKHIQARNSVYPSLIGGVTYNAAVMTLTGADGHVRFRRVSIEHFGLVGDTHPYRWDTEGALTFDANGNGVCPDATISTNTKYTQGIEGFGTTEWMLSNLKLPTLENRSIVAANWDENPIPGQLYDQYTWYTAKEHELGGIQTVVGGVASTKVGHTFYLPQSITGPGTDGEGAGSLGLSKDFALAIAGANTTTATSNGAFTDNSGGTTAANLLVTIKTVKYNTTTGAIVQLTNDKGAFIG
jgi:hypothetical protein